MLDAGPVGGFARAVNWWNGKMVDAAGETPTRMPAIEAEAILTATWMVTAKKKNKKEIIEKNKLNMYACVWARG